MTWGEDLKKYELEKSRLPWESDGAIVKNYYTTVNHRFSTKKQALSNIFLSSDIAAPLTRKKGNLSSSRLFDIITNQSVGDDGIESAYKVADGRKCLHRVPDSRVSFNILTNLDLDLNSVESSSEKRHKILNPYSRSQRNFNIISNCSDNSNEEKNENEIKVLAKNTQKLLRRMNEKNVVTGVYYDSTKEHESQETIEKHEQDQRSKKISQLPLKISNSEGRIYDILSKQVKDPEKFEKMTKIWDRNLLCRRVRYEKNLEVIQQRNNRALVLEMRRSNHNCMKRNAESIARGYDLLTNQNLTNSVKSTKFVEAKDST